MSLLIGLALVVVGALVFATSSSPPERQTFTVQATVTEAPTAGGGVLLDVPMGMSQIGIDGGASVPPQPWETHDLDPAGVRVGDVVSVELDPNCYCDPRILGSDDDSVPFVGLVGLALVALGIAVAVVGRSLPARPAAGGATASAAAVGPGSAPTPVGPGWGPPAPPPAQ